MCVLVCVLHRSNRGVDASVYEVTEEALVKSCISAGKNFFTYCHLLMFTLG